MQEESAVSDLRLPREKVVGLKQTLRAVAEGRAREVYLACDADPRLIEPLKDACGTSVSLHMDMTMAQLGKAAGIAVGTAACALLG